MSDLIRFNVKSHDQTPATFAEAPQGYWTPWYIAQRKLNDSRQQLDDEQRYSRALEQRIKILEERMQELVSDAHTLRFKAKVMDATASAITKGVTSETVIESIRLAAQGLRNQADEAAKGGV